VYLRETGGGLFNAVGNGSTGGAGGDRGLLSGHGGLGGAGGNGGSVWEQLGPTDRAGRRYRFPVRHRRYPKEVFGMCSKSKAQTDLHIFEARGHSLTIDNGWKDVADVALQWLAANSL
jgi:hypothetical protein